MREFYEDRIEGLQDGITQILRTIDTVNEENQKLARNLTNIKEVKGGKMRR